VQAFVRCTFGRCGFQGSVCLTRPASEVCTFVLDFHNAGWVWDGRQEAASVHGGLGYKHTGGIHVSYVVFN